MACYLTAPSYYLNQCWPISKIRWHSSKGKFTRDTSASITEIIWKIKYLKFHSNFPGANELIGRTTPTPCLLMARFSVSPGYQQPCYYVHWVRDKMTAIFQTLKYPFLNENVGISFTISVMFVSKVPINSKPTLFQIMAWHRPGDKPLPEPMLSKFIDTYMRHSASMRYNHHHRCHLVSITCISPVWDND